MSIKALQEKYIQKSTHPKVLHENWMSDDETIHEKLQGEKLHCPNSYMLQVYLCNVAWTLVCVVEITAVHVA